MFIILCCLCVLLQTSLCITPQPNSLTDNNSSKSEIRCYCNLPACITTSYMCKSEGLGCFSDIIAFSDVNKASHGCLDLLDSGRQDHCQNEPGPRSPSGQPSPRPHPHSLLLCCFGDLCNHVDSPETRQRYNDSVYASSLVTDLDRGVMIFNTRMRQPPTYTSAEVWFRAATIAVPICGALILFVLIALAVRILQSDAIDDRMLAAKLRAKHSGFSPVSMNGPSFVHQLHDCERNDINRDYSTKKMPLLMQPEANRPSHGQGVNMLHSCQQRHKNEANAKLNLSHAPDPLPVTTIASPEPLPAPVHSSQPEQNLIDLTKPTSPSNNSCNIYDSADEAQPACALLSAPTNHKLTYKKPLVISWTEADIRANSH